MNAHPSFAASTKTLPRVGDSQPVGRRGTDMASLPTWARTHEAIQLLAAIKLQRPHIIVYDDGLSAWNGRRYTGRNAALLREMFDTAFHGMLQHPTLEHNTLVAWREANNADVLIARTLGEAL